MKNKRTHFQKPLLALALALLTLPDAQAQSVNFFKAGYCATNSGGEAITNAWDGNFYFTDTYVAPAPEGSSSLDVLLVKITPAGDTLWKRTFGTPDKNEVGWCIATPQNNTILIGGIADAMDGSHSGSAFLTKLDGSGNPVWFKKYDIPGVRTAVTDILPLTDGYALCGSHTDLATGNTNAWLLKTDANGEGSGPRITAVQTMMMPGSWNARPAAALCWVAAATPTVPARNMMMPG